MSRLSTLSHLPRTMARVADGSSKLSDRAKELCNIAEFLKLADEKKKLVNPRNRDLDEYIDTYWHGPDLYLLNFRASEIFAQFLIVCALDAIEIPSLVGLVLPSRSRPKDDVKMWLIGSCKTDRPGLEAAFTSPFAAAGVNLGPPHGYVHPECGDFVVSHHISKDVINKCWGSEQALGAHLRELLEPTLRGIGIDFHGGHGDNPQHSVLTQIDRALNPQSLRRLLGTDGASLLDGVSLETYKPLARFFGPAPDAAALVELAEKIVQSLSKGRGVRGPVADRSNNSWPSGYSSAILSDITEDAHMSSHEGPAISTETAGCTTIDELRKRMREAVHKSGLTYAEVGKRMPGKKFDSPRAAEKAVTYLINSTPNPTFSALQSFCSAVRISLADLLS